jgi:hypothetical protein
MKAKTFIVEKIVYGKTLKKIAYNGVGDIFQMSS